MRFAGTERISALSGISNSIVFLCALCARIANPRYLVETQHVLYSRGWSGSARRDYNETHDDSFLSTVAVLQKKIRLIASDFVCCICLLFLCGDKFDGYRIGAIALACSFCWTVIKNVAQMSFAFGTHDFNALHAITAVFFINN